MKRRILSARLSKRMKLRNSEISEYPDRRYARLAEPSFDNIPSAVKQTTSLASDFITDRSVSSRPTMVLPKRNGPSTFHFKIDANKNRIQLKKEIHFEDELGIDPLDKALKISNASSNLFQPRPDEPFKNRTVDYRSMSKLGNLSVDHPRMYENEYFNYQEENKYGQSMVSEDFDISKSKLMWKNRSKVPSKSLVKPNHKYIIDPKLFHQGSNLLRIDVNLDSVTETKIIEIFHAAMEAASDPNRDKNIRKNIIFDCRRFFRS
jgi:hypothetical protein